VPCVYIEMLQQLNHCVIFVSNIDDFSRVKLREIPGKEGSDYINASYIDVNYHPIM